MDDYSHIILEEIMASIDLMLIPLLILDKEAYHQVSLNPFQFHKRKPHQVDREILK